MMRFLLALVVGLSSVGLAQEGVEELLSRAEAAYDRWHGEFDNGRRPLTTVGMGNLIFQVMREGFGRPFSFGKRRCPSFPSPPKGTTF